jgi:hypothetical protein
MPVEFASLEEV